MNNLKNNQPSLLYLPNIINSESLIVPNITSPTEYVKNKYNSCLRTKNYNVKKPKWEEIKNPIYNSPKLIYTNINKDFHIDFKELVKENFPIIDKQTIHFRQTLFKKERNKNTVFNMNCFTSETKDIMSDLSKFRMNSEPTLGRKNENSISIEFNNEEIINKIKNNNRGIDTLSRQPKILLSFEKDKLASKSVRSLYKREKLSNISIKK